MPETPLPFEEVLVQVHAILASADAAKAVQRFEAFWWHPDVEFRIPGPDTSEQWELVWGFVDDLHLFEPKPEWQKSGMFGAEEARARVVELLKKLGEPTAT